MSDATEAALVAELVQEIGADRGRQGHTAVAPEIRPPTSILSLIAALLVEVCEPGEAVACTLIPSDDRYAVRLPRVAGKKVLLPRGALERALTDPMARVRVRDLL